MLSFFLTHFPADHDYPFLPLSLVGSYQVGYTRSHPNTEVKMLRACSVPLCSHRWERQVIYLLFFFYYHYHNCHHYTITTTVPILHILSRYNCTRYMPAIYLCFPFTYSLRPPFTFIKKTSLAGVEPAIFRFVV